MILGDSWWKSEFALPHILSAPARQISLNILLVSVLFTEAGDADRLSASAQTSQHDESLLQNPATTAKRASS